MAKKNHGASAPNAPDGDNKAPESQAGATPNAGAQNPGGTEGGAAPGASSGGEQPPAGGEQKATTKIETVAEKPKNQSKPSVAADVKVFAEHLREAARQAAQDGDAVAHAALENLLVRLHDFKSQLGSVEDHLEGEASKVLERIKAIL